MWRARFSSVGGSFARTLVLFALALAGWYLARDWWWKLLLGLALVPFQAWGICAEWLLQVALYSGPAPARQAGFGAVAANLIGAPYQLGFLMFPALAPVLVWLAFDRKRMATALLGGALSAGRGH